MQIAVAVSFMVLFALVLLAVSVGLKFFDARRKSQVAEMLQTASGEQVTVVTNLLKDIDLDKPTGFKRVLASFQFSRHAQQQIQQAGLSWSSARLITAMGLAMIPGLGLGAWWKILLNGPTSAPPGPATTRLPDSRNSGPPRPGRPPRCSPSSRW